MLQQKNRIARLALALYHQFPREYRYFSTREFDFRGEIVRSHNHLLDWYQGADGIKTGFVNASGFNLAASAVRDGHRQIGVIMGGRSWRSRDEQMASLLDQGFAVLAAARSAQPQYAPPAAAAAVAAAAPAAAPAIAAPPASLPQAASVPAVSAAAPPDSVAHQRPEALLLLSLSSCLPSSIPARFPVSPPELDCPIFMYCPISIFTRG